MDDVFYPEIVLEGENFSPSHLKERYSNINIERANEKGDVNPRLKKVFNTGYCILRPNQNGPSEEVIICLLDQFGAIYNDGLVSNGIEKAIFYLVIETLQNRTTLSKKTILRIFEYFDELNISMVSDE